MGGFSDEVFDKHLNVDFPEELLKIYPEDKQTAILEILRQDPRPSYQNDPGRRYGVSFAGFDVHFYVNGDRLTVTEVVPL